MGEDNREIQDFINKESKFFEVVIKDGTAGSCMLLNSDMVVSVTQDPETGNALIKLSDRNELILVDSSYQEVLRALGYDQINYL